jgi:outer membrane protein W
MTIVAIAAVTLVAPSQAQEAKSKVFGGAAYVSPLSDESVTFGDVTDSIDAASQTGWDVGFEWRMTKRLGLEVDYLNATHDIEFGGTTIGEADLQPLSATLNFHLIRTRLIDLYLGPTFSYVNWGDVNLNEAGQDATDALGIPTKSETAYGASVGIDIGLGKTLAIVGGVRYLKLDLTPEDGDGVGVDPLITRVGVAIRF